MKKIKNMTKSQIITLVSLLVVLAGLITGVVLLYPKTKEESPKKPIEAKVEVKKETSIEVYTKLPSIEDFTKEEGKLDLANVPSEDSVCPEEETECVVEKLATTIGEYEVVIAIKEKEYKSTLKVIDSTKPTLKTKDVSITEGETYTVDSFIEEKSDNSKKEVKAYFEEEAMASLTEVKEHTVKITVEDESGNKTTNETKLTINKKKEESKPVSNSKPASTTKPSTGNSSSNSGSSNTSSGSSNSGGSSTPAPSPAPSAPAVQECTINGPYTGLYANGTRDADYVKWEAEIIRVKDFISTSASNKQRFGDGAASSKGPETVVHDSCGKAVGYIMRIEANYISTGEAHYDEGGNLVVDVAPVKYHMEYYLDHNGNWVVTSNPHNIAWR